MAENAIGEVVMLWNIFCKVVLALAVLISAINISGCGGGGSSAPAVDVPVDHWISRAGSSQSVLFKSFTTVMTGAIASSDCSGGSLLFGRDVASEKAIYLRLDASGNEIWKQFLTPPFRNSIIPEDLNCTMGDAIFPMIQKRAPYGDWYLSVSQLSDGAIVSDQVNINGPIPILETPWQVESAKALSDGNFILSVRIFGDGKSALYYQDLTRTNPDITIVPAILPKYIAIDLDGIIVASDNAYMKYARDLTVLQEPTAWSNAADAKIHGIKTDGIRTMIFGVENGKYKISDPDNVAFRCAKEIPVGNDMVQGDFSENGDFYVSVGPRIGMVNMQTGDMLTTDPPAIPDAPWFVSGDKVFSIVGGQELRALPLSEIPNN